MFHAELFSSSIASGANTFAQVNYVTTGAVLPPAVNGLQVSPDVPNLQAVAGIGSHLVHVRPQSTSMLPFPYDTLSPNNRGGAAESPPRIHDFSQTPWPLRPTEEFDIFATQNSGSSETEYVLALFSNGAPQPYPVQPLPPGLATAPQTPGKYTSAHWTASATLTAGGWTSVTPAFDQPLPAGYYAIIGARAFSATALFFRLKPSMGTSPYRPGGVAVQAYDSLDPPNQRFIPSWAAESMGWGVWLFFYQNVPPYVEIFATSADTAEEGWFDLLYISQSVTQQAS
jgi:hypothetical protein